jgi:hypothetical protein
MVEITYQRAPVPHTDRVVRGVTFNPRMFVGGNEIARVQRQIGKY